MEGFSRVSCGAAAHSRPCGISGRAPASSGSPACRCTAPKGSSPRPIPAAWTSPARISRPDIPFSGGAGGSGRARAAAGGIPEPRRPYRSAASFRKRSRPLR
jgi:hypothetical protein